MQASCRCATGHHHLAKTALRTAQAFQRTASIAEERAELDAHSGDRPPGETANHLRSKHICVE
jgi:hypothetical protein